MSIGTNIKRLRLSEGLSQDDLGRLLGVSGKAVSTWENEIKVPRMGTVQRLADHFGIAKSVILDDDANIDAQLLTNKKVISLSEIQLAFAGKVDKLTEANKQILLDMADVLLNQQKGDDKQ